MVDLALAVPDYRLVALHVADAGLLVLEGLDLEQRHFDGAHVLVDQADLEFLLVEGLVPEDAVYYSLRGPQFLLLCGLKLVLAGTLDVENVVLEGLHEEGLAGRGFHPFGLVLEPLMVFFLLLVLANLIILRFLAFFVLVFEGLVHLLTLLVGQLQFLLLLLDHFLLLALAVEHALVDLAPVRSDVCLVPPAEDSIDAVVALEEVHPESHGLRNLS